MYGKKFHFYVNRCTNCLATTDISLRPHKQTLCLACTKKFQRMKEAGKNPRTVMDVPDEIGEIDEPDTVVEISE